VWNYYITRRHSPKSYKKNCHYLENLKSRVRVKQSLYRPGQALRVPGRFQGNRHMKMVRLLALRRPQSHSTAGRVVSIKNYSDTIGNRTRDLPAACQNLVYCDNIYSITINVATSARQSTVQNWGFLNFQYPYILSKSNGAPRPTKCVKIIGLYSASRPALRGWNDRGVSWNCERPSFRYVIADGHLARFIARMRAG